MVITTCSLDNLAIDFAYWMYAFHLLKLMVFFFNLDFYSVLSVYMFGTIDPENFGNLAVSAKVYLQVSSLDLWSQIYFKSKYQAPSIFPVLVSYIIIQTFVLLNLLTAVIVDNLAMLRKKLAKSKKKKVGCDKCMDFIDDLEYETQKDVHFKCGKSKR